MKFDWCQKPVCKIADGVGCRIAKSKPGKTTNNGPASRQKDKEKDKNDEKEVTNDDKKDENQDKNV